MCGRRSLMVGIIAAALMLTLGIGSVVGGMVGYYLAGRAIGTATPAAWQASMPLQASFAEQPSLTAEAAEPTPPPVASPTVDPNDDPLVAAVARVQPATVTVLNRTLGSSGSGVFIDAAGHLVTNYHVVEGGRRFEIIYYDGGRASVTLVGVAPEFDLAVLKVNGRVPAWAVLGDSAAMAVGSRVAAIGSALGGFRNTVTAGVLSAHNRSLGELDGLLQTDAAINQGNSGGPLVNLAGEVIGINTMVVRGGYNLAEGLGFAIPSNIVKVVARQLIEKGRVEPPFLGITYVPLNPQLAEQFGVEVTQGVLIRAVVPNSAGSRAGLRAGDVIVAIDGQKIDDRHPLAQLLLQRSIGDTVTLEVNRGGETFTLKVTLGPRPSL